jgi:hypothetical protein
MTALRWFLPRSCAASNHPFGSHFPDKSRPALPRGGKEVQSRLNKLQPSTTTIPALRSKPKLRGAEHSIAARSCSGDFGVRRSAPLWTGVNRATRPYYFSNCFRIVSVRTHRDGATIHTAESAAGPSANLPSPLAGRKESGRERSRRSLAPRHRALM